VIAEEISSVQVTAHVSPLQDVLASHEPTYTIQIRNNSSRLCLFDLAAGVIFWKAQCRKTTSTKTFWSRIRCQRRHPQPMPTLLLRFQLLPHVLIPPSLLFRSVLLEGDSIDVGVGSDVEEEVAEAGVVLSDDGVTGMTVYVADEVEGVAASVEVVADVLCAVDLHRGPATLSIATGVGITDLAEVAAKLAIRTTWVNTSFLSSK